MFKKVLPFLTLFTSLGTLICCAIPALLVTIGMGASLAATISAFPQLIWFSEHKNIVFGFAGAMILGTFLVRRYTRESACPADPKLAEACRTSRRISGYILYFSLVIYLTGGFFAFYFTE